MISILLWWVISLAGLLLQNILSPKLCVSILSFCLGSFLTVTVLGLSRRKEHTTKTYQLAGPIEIRERNGQFPKTTFWFIEETSGDVVKRTMATGYIILFVNTSPGKVIIHSNAVPSRWQLWCLTRLDSSDWYELIVPDTSWIQLKPGKKGG